jgi:hypothetical protein
MAAKLVASQVVLSSTELVSCFKTCFMLTLSSKLWDWRLVVYLSILKGTLRFFINYINALVLLLLYPSALLCYKGAFK